MRKFRAHQNETPPRKIHEEVLEINFEATLKGVKTEGAPGTFLFGSESYQICSGTFPYSISSVKQEGLKSTAYIGLSLHSLWMEFSGVDDSAQKSKCWRHQTSRETERVQNNLSFLEFLLLPSFALAQLVNRSITESFICEVSWE